MTWVKLDDRAPEHPKFVAVGPLGLALWVAGLAYCNRQETDGVIPYDMIPQLLAWKWTDDEGRVWEAAMTSGLEGRDADPYTIADMLVKAHLWKRQSGRRRNENIPAAFLVHDYEHYQPTRAQLTALREQNRRRQADFRKRQSRRDTPVSNAVTEPLVTHAPSRSTTPTPREGVVLRDRSEETGAAAPATPDGAAPLNGARLTALAQFVKREWDHYPNLDVLRDELTDRGATPDQAKQIIDAEQATRA